MMTESQAENIILETKVYWDKDKKDQGIIVAKSAGALFIQWENGDKGWINNKDLHKVSVFSPEQDKNCSKE